MKPEEVGLVPNPFAPRSLLTSDPNFRCPHCASGVRFAEPNEHLCANVLTTCTCGHLHGLHGDEGCTMSNCLCGRFMIREVQ